MKKSGNSSQHIASFISVPGRYYVHYKNIRVTVCKNRVHMVQSVVVFAENLTKSKQSWPYDSLIDVNKRLWHPTTHQNPRGNDIFRLAFIQGKQAVRHQPWDMIEAIFIDGDNSVRRRWGQCEVQIHLDTDKSRHRFFSLWVHWSMQWKEAGPILTQLDGTPWALLFFSSKQQCW